MRVLHLSTATSGGAALAALRLVDAQQRFGVNAALITQHRGVVIGLGDRKRIPFWSRLAQRGTTALDLGLSRDRRYFFSALDFGVLDIRDIRSAEPDVVHVHNWFNFFPWRLAAELREHGVAVVATAHDERIMTGGCHTTLGCDNYLEGCLHCPQSRLGAVARRPALRLHENLSVGGVTIVAPSSWLWSRLTRRFAGTAARVCEIPNCLDTEIFHPPEKGREGQVTLGVMTGKADVLLETLLGNLVSLLGLERAERISLHVAGRGAAPRWPGPVLHFGYLSSDAERAKFFQACDIAIAPTHADNFPNVNLEATLSGAAVLTCDVGGSGEVIRATGRGLAVEGSAQSMASGAVQLLQSIDELRSSTWTTWTAANSLYGYEPVVHQYAAVYEAAIRGLNP